MPLTIRDAFVHLSYDKRRNCLHTPFRAQVKVPVQDLLSLDNLALPNCRLSTGRA